MPSKTDLLETIEKQREKISKYEARLIDLIRSYKSLQKEKAALQESLSAVIGNSTYSVNNESEEIKEEVEAQSDAESVQSEIGSESSEIGCLSNKVKTLQNSLKILSIEREKNETFLKEDRKILLEEKKKLEMQLEIEKGDNRNINKDLKSKLDETKSKLAQNQMDREKEMNNGMTMIRELEAKLAKERGEKDKLESMLYSSKEKQKSLSAAAKSSEIDQRTIASLQSELEQVRRQLNKAVHQCQEPPLLKKLQYQMKEMQMQYKQAISQEQIRAESTEKNAREICESQEERVTSLEKKLSELYLNAANYDKTKQSQRETINVLKERLQELSQENSKLTSRESSPINNDPKPMPEADLATLTKSLVNTWERIHDFNEKTTNSIDIEGLLVGSEIIHAQCNKDYTNLKEKFESMKLTKNSNICTCGLQCQVHDLRDRVRSLMNDANLTQKTHSEQISTLNNDASAVRRLHEAQLFQLQQEHRVAVSNLEQQLFDHCQRSLKTLGEREEEISRLSQELHKIKKDSEGQPKSVAAALLAQVETSGGMEGPLLHHLEEMARKELEIVELRRHKRQLERALRDLQGASIERQEFLQDSVFRLENEVKRLNRNMSREGENLEYLKNVIIKYMISSSGQSKQFMLNAISAVLKFSPEELESVKSVLDPL